MASRMVTPALCAHTPIFATRGDSDVLPALEGRGQTGVLQARSLLDSYGGRRRDGYCLLVGMVADR